MKVVIFGAGSVTEKLLEYPLQQNVSIAFICDNDKKKWEQKINGYQITTPTKINEIDYDYILIATRFFGFIDEILDELESIHVKKENIIVFTGFETIEYCECPLDKIFKIKKQKPKLQFKKGSAQIYQNYIGETSKAHKRRKREKFFEKYCQGEGLDIGYGADLIVPQCSGWDLRNGDAQYMEGIEDESFDFVYSSHCLEHVNNVRCALKNWFRLVRKGGYLIISIPHRDLYEKRKRLPSRWNRDHKHMFLIGAADFPDTLDIVEEIRTSLNNYIIIYVKICDEGHTITDPLIHSDGEFSIEIVIKKLC